MKLFFRLAAYGGLFYGAATRNYPVMAASGWFILLSRIDDVENATLALLALSPEYQKELARVKAEREKSL